MDREVEWAKGARKKSNLLAGAGCDRNVLRQVEAGGRISRAGDRGVETAGGQGECASLFMGLANHLMYIGRCDQSKRRKRRPWNRAWSDESRKRRGHTCGVR